MLILIVDRVLFFDDIRNDILTEAVNAAQLWASRQYSNQQCCQLATS